MDVFSPVKAVASSGLVVAMIGFTVAESATACFVMLAAAATSVLSPSSPSSVLSAVSRALAAVLVPKPDRPKLPLVGTASGFVAAPVENSVTPAADVITGKLWPDTGAIASASLPPQPVLDGPRGIDVCHWDCWSACEN